MNRCTGHVHFCTIVALAVSLLSTKRWSSDLKGSLSSEIFSEAIAQVNRVWENYSSVVQRIIGISFNNLAILSLPRQLDQLQAAVGPPW